MDHDESLTDKAYLILKKEIVTCQLPPGERLSQANLSDRIGIGITPIREALQRLAHEGFVEAVPRHGFIVTTLDVSDLAEIFDMRQILEQAAVRLAVERGTDEDLKTIRDRSDFVYTFQDHDTYLIFLDMNIDFHLAIAKLTGNERLVDTISKLLVEMTRVFQLGLDLRDSGEEMRLEHIELADALLGRDSDRAVQVVRRQIDTSLGRIIEALSNEVVKGNNAIIRDMLRPRIFQDRG